MTMLEQHMNLTLSPELTPVLPEMPLWLETVGLHSSALRKQVGAEIPLMLFQRLQSRPVSSVVVRLVDFRTQIWQLSLNKDFLNGPPRVPTAQCIPRGGTF